MPASSSFQRLLSRIAEGDSQQAAEMITKKFADDLARLAAKRMSKRLQQRIDPEEIVQSIFMSFFRLYDDGRLEWREWDSLWGYLMRIAVWKILHKAQSHSAAKRHMQNEVALPIDVSVLDRVPGPEDVLVAEELREQLLNGVGNKYRPIAERILDGATHEVIAKELGTSISTVERVHRRALKSLIDLLAAEEAA